MADWKVEIKGERLSEDWEISVVKKGHHGEESWGWFDDEKILISDDSHGQVVIPGRVFDCNVKIANEICDDLNNGMDIKELFK